MTPEKAIKFFDEEIIRLERAPIINGCEMTDDWKEQLEIYTLAKSALEKQIPKKDKFGYCSICKRTVNCACRPSKNKFCRNCGQALDWSDAE